jgi:heat-inducible transcriptional repressor
VVSGLGSGAVRELSERQTTVLRALVAAYIGDVGPVGSSTISRLIPVSLSSASVRNTMAELMELGLIEQPHPSAGRVPTELGLRVFVDHLLDRHGLGPYEKRDLAGAFAEAAPQAVIRVASQLLSERTRQLGFVLSPRVDRLPLRHVSLVRLSRTRVLAVLVAQAGSTRQLVIEDDGPSDQVELDRLAARLNDWCVGHTLTEVRTRVAREASALRAHAGRLLERALRLARSSVDADPVEVDDLVIATRLALLDQPEFRDPECVRQLFEAVEARATLVRVLDKMIQAPGVQVAFGGELEEPELRRFALVAAPYGERSRPLGLLGVIGPSRMDYARVIPFVEYLSELMTGKLCA